MAVTTGDIRQWLLRGKSEQATHVVVVCDTFNWSDYPVYVKADQDVEEVIGRFSANMQKVMEVYNLGINFETQLGEWRAWHL